MPRVDSMPTAATATPYKSACDVASRVTTTTIMTGASVLIMPSAKPRITTMPAPPSAEAESDFVGP